MSRVIFIGYDDRFVYDPARAFGELVFLEIDVVIFEPEEYMQSIVKKLQEINFSEKNDFIAMTGPMLEVAYLSMAVRSMSKESINLLIFSARQESYRHRTVRIANAG